ncbi:unnamed protein product [Rotaria sp. Silwood2]|nr:unnamed protein product [Rotaria sp. Silwood2]
MACFSILPISNDMIPKIEYGDEIFIEIHLDERYYVGDNAQLCKVWKKDEKIIIEKQFKIFSDPDQCFDFITSYEWRKVFLTITDQFTYILPLIHDIKQIVYIYIYSQSPDKVPYNSSIYSKLRSIVDENSSNADAVLLQDIEDFRRDLMPIKVINPVERKIKLLIHEKMDIDEYSIVWLHNNENSTFIDTSSIFDITNSFKSFYNVDQCLNYLTSESETKIFFITSYLDYELILSKVFELSRVISIYLFYNDPNSINISNKFIKKLRGIFSDMKTLCNQLSEEYKQNISMQKMSISIFHEDKHEKTIRNLSKDNARFLWFQLLINVLIRIPHNDQAKEQMINDCRIHYKDDSKAQRDIEKFNQTYKSSEALRFYTEDSFLYRLFNQALRKENIDFLFIFRFFMADMYNQLQQLYMEQFQNNSIQNGTGLMLFRGQIMSDIEFNYIKENIGRVISVNTFFSTTAHRQVAIIFSGAVPNVQNANYVSVLFEIDTNVLHNRIKRPFASLEAFSKIKDESEVLFAVGSTFRIESIHDYRTNEGYWYVKMKLAEDTDEINELRNQLEKQYCNQGDLCSIGQILRGMGDYKKAERYFLMLLECIPERHPSYAQICSSLGMISRDKGDYQTSLKYHELALKNFNQINIYDQHDNICFQYASLGSTYHLLGNNDLALKYLTMAINDKSSPSLLSLAYNQIGIIYRGKGEFRLALEYFQKTLNIEEEILKTNKYAPVLATMHNNIGEIYVHLDDDDNAIKHLNQALEIRLKGTVSTHTDLAAIYNNLGMLYNNKNAHRKALEMLEKALEIDTNLFDENHESLSVTHYNISGAYLGMGDLAKAVYHSETALRIQLRSQARDDQLIISKYQLHLGRIQLELGNFTKALKIAEKALNIQLKYLPDNHRDFTYTYLLFSNIHEKEGNIIKAIEYLEKSEDIARISILPYNRAEYDRIQLELKTWKTNYFGNGKKYSRSSKNITCASDNTDLQDCLISNHLQELEKISPLQLQKRIGLLHSLVSLYSRKENYPMAIKYLDRIHSIYTEHISSALIDRQELEDLMAGVYYSESRIYYRQKNWIMSLNILNKALDLVLKQDTENQMLAEIYYAIGLTYSHLFDLSMAIHNVQLAVQTARKYFSNDHPSLEKYLTQLSIWNVRM